MSELEEIRRDKTIQDKRMKKEAGPNDRKLTLTGSRSMKKERPGGAGGRGG